MLRRLGLAFRVVSPDVPETPWSHEAPEAFARRVARAKAEAVRRSEPDATVLAADTVVVLDGVPLGKPADMAEARTMMASLSGRTHSVITAYRILGPDLDRGREVVTAVSMKQLGPGELEAYLGTGDWKDKAGAYGIQSAAAHLVERIEGSYTNVVGLPLCEVIADLLEAGVIAETDLWAQPRSL